MLTEENGSCVRITLEKIAESTEPRHFIPVGNVEDKYVRPGSLVFRY